MSNWYKTAGIVEPPPAMVKAVLARVRDYVHGHQKGVVVVSIPIDLSGWKYGDKRGEVEAAIKKVQQNLFDVEDANPAIKAMMEKIGPREQRLAKALEPSHSIKLRMGITLPEISAASWQAPFATLQINIRGANERGMKTCVEHELVHFAQTYLQLALYGRDQLNHAPGHPSKSISNPTVYQRDKPHDAAQHGLDDREFYTNLYELISAIKARVGSSGVTPQSIRSIMDNSPWLRVLKSKPEGQGKYQKAVSEIWKAVDIMPKPSLQ
jgi:hypothetical protein